MTPLQDGYYVTENNGRPIYFAFLGETLDYLKDAKDNYSSVEMYKAKSGELTLSRRWLHGELVVWSR